MKRILIYCEGQTEETFVNQLLAPYLLPREIYLKASCCGGVSKYSKIKRELNTWCKGDPNGLVTTMLDYYALPSDTPGLDRTAGGDVFQKVLQVENSIKADIGADNLIPNLILHEFEALLFSRPECFAYCGMRERDISRLCEIRAKAQSPEHINDNPNTAPSKRILSIYPSYSKRLDGFNIAKDIGIDWMRQECKHFNAWIEALIS